MTRLKHHAHRLTTSGYYVAGFKPSTFYYRSLKDNAPSSIRIYSGRVTRDAQGEWLDPGQYARWHLDGRAIKHEFGDLVLSEGKDL